MDLFDELKWRGLVYDATDGLADAFENERVTAYIGFDPTASSLHIGNLLGLVTLARLQRYGHAPIAIAGGGTGMIGDPSGKSQERTLLTLDQINANHDGIRREVREARSGHDLARRGAHAGPGIPAVLAQHRRSGRHRLPEVLHVPRARGDRRTRRAGEERAGKAERAAGAGGSGDEAGA